MKFGGTVLDRYAAIYKKIGEELQKALPADWAKSWTSVEMDAQQGAVVVYYVGAAPAIAWIKPPLKLYEYFRQLNNAARTSGEMQAWTTATFTLERGGEFTIDFGYEPIPIEEEAKRDAAWKARYLPRR